jgi:hypothetical protein
MLMIRNEQMAVFKSHLENRFKNRLAIHVYTHFPAKCQYFGEERVQAAIHSGVERAKGYGIVSERDIAKYVHLVFAFHEEFDCDPELPWAARILKDETLVGPSTRMECLFQEAKQHVPGLQGEIASPSP